MANDKLAKKGKTLNDLRALHDRTVIVPNKIRAGIAALAKDGPENWAYSEDFRKLAGLSPPDLKDYRDEFKEFWIDLPGTNGRRDAKVVWFATTKAAKAMRAI